MYAIENGPSGFDPAEPELSAQAAIPDADAQRPAGRAADRVRRGEPHADDPLREPRGGARRSSDAGGARRDRAVLRRVLRRRIARPAEGAARRRATAFPMWPGRWCRSSISPRSRRWRMRPAPRFIRCAFAAISKSKAGRPGMSSICSTRRSRSAERAAEGGQAHRALRRDRGRSRHRHPRPADPAHADEDLRPRRLRRLCGGDRGRRRSPSATS